MHDSWYQNAKVTKSYVAELELGDDTKMLRYLSIVIVKNMTGE